MDKRTDTKHDQFYNKNYYHCGCGPASYEDPESWALFFGDIADYIVKVLHPKTVLDTGCVFGYLVAALRDRGVDAYGIDISEYAISKVREDVRQFCKVGSLTETLPEALPQTYDLVIKIEAMEHLCEADGKTVIECLCKYGDTIIFCSVSDDTTDINMQKREYWAKLFAGFGYYNDINNRPAYINAFAFCYRKDIDCLNAIENYERYIKLTDENIQKDKLKLCEKDNFIENLNQKYIKKCNEYEYLKDKLAIVQNNYDKIANARLWKITKPIRVVLGAVKKLLGRSRLIVMVYNGLLCLKEKGFSYTKKEMKSRLKEIFPKKAYNRKALKAQRLYRFNKDIRFSILVPLYNTPTKILKDMINSVLSQTYGNWELCMADGSDETHNYVNKICTEYRDKRIKYKKLDKNLGISENTNACIKLATGDYIALLDHDDILHPAALYENMQVICEHNADFIYTDEAIFRNKPADANTKHYKPDFAIDNLRSNNYICHFSVFSRGLLEKAGCFRSEYDGSQDYDMVLRLTENAKKIVHIPIILYYWRATKSSVASDIAAKPYAITAAKKAISEHLKRVGLKGEVVNSQIPTTYKINYEINGNPLISILIPNKDHLEDLKKCLDSIFQKTTYSNYEIILIENNSVNEETFHYYNSLKSNARVKIVQYNNKFNYSAINNYGFTFAKGEHILLLNNDIEVITPNWLEEMLMFSQRKDVGAVGAKMYYSNDTVQHAGVIIGLLGVAGHLHRNLPRNHPGYMGRLTYAQNLSAVTGACFMLPRHVFEEVNGLDESFAVAFNDVDFCMKIRSKGYLIVFTPYAELYHDESKSRGLDDIPEKRERFLGEVERFQTRWEKELKAGDPYYNPNLPLYKEDCII